MEWFSCYFNKNYNISCVRVSVCTIYYYVYEGSVDWFV